MIDPALLAVATVFFVAAGVGLVYAVWADADVRGANATVWALCTVLFPPLALPAYLFVRRRLPARAAPPGRAERLAGSVGVGGLASLFAGAVLAPPDPVTQVFYTLPVAAISIPLAYVVWYRPRRRGIPG